MSEDDVYQILESKFDGLKKHERVEKDDDNIKTYDEVFDHATLLTIYKLITNKVIKSLDFPISTGKEANVFKATTMEGEDAAVKIYRISTSTFKSFKKYLDGDPRFKNVKKKGHRAVVYAWAQKEYKNLKRMFNIGVRVPEPIMYTRNVLLMEYIGDELGPAPMLKNVPIKAPTKKFRLLVKAVRKMYQEARIVHGDLSEYNILMLADEMVIIDVSQSVVIEHPMAEEMLVRDVSNLVRYFKKYGEVDGHRRYS